MLSAHTLLSPTKHLILSACGSRWKESLLAMFTVYIDDGGTDPKQSIAIASALILPADRIELLDHVWSELLHDELIHEFHTSECIAGQKCTQFEGWSSQRKKRICFKVREITKAFFVGGCSMAIDKAHYDQLVPLELKLTGGRYHYTWAIRHVISWLDEWAIVNGIQTPYEYVFDYMGNNKRNEAKREIESVMDQAESIRPGFYQGHFAFRSRRDHPGLQCADLTAWANYRLACSVLDSGKPNSIADETFWDYEEFRKGEWMMAMIQTPAHLKDWADREIADPRSQERRRQWLLKHPQRP